MAHLETHSLVFVCAKSYLALHCHPALLDMTQSVSCNMPLTRAFNSGLYNHAPSHKKTDPVLLMLIEKYSLCPKSLLNDNAHSHICHA